MRVGIIGTGFGARVVAPSFEATEGCDVAGVVSPRDEASVKALCERGDLDLVSVHSPPFMHFDHVRRALDAGHAVLCDKPFGRNAEEAAEMCGLAGDAGVAALVNFEMRYDPVRRHLRRMVRDGALGRPEHVLCTSILALSRSPMRPYGWLFDAELGGGWIGAWGSHLIDFIRWVFGEIVDGTASLRTAIPERPDREGRVCRCTAEDGFTASFGSASGVTVSVDSTFAAPVNMPPRLTIVGCDAAVELVGATRVTRRDAAGGEEEIVVPGADGGLSLTMRKWAAVIRDAALGGPLPADAPTFADGLACRQVMDRLLA